MRTVAISMTAEIFNKIGTPSSLMFREPFVEDIFYNCIISGEDADIKSYMFRVAELSDLKDYEALKELSSETWTEMLNNMEEWAKKSGWLFS